MIRTVVSALCAIVITAGLGMPATSFADDEAQELWNEFCLSCHGQQGKGDGPAAETLKKKPADLSDCKKMEGERDDRLHSIIAKGGSANDLSDEMAAWGDRLDSEEIDILISYIRGFCK